MKALFLQTRSAIHRSQRPHPRYFSTRLRPETATGGWLSLSPLSAVLNPDNNNEEEDAIRGSLQDLATTWSLKELESQITRRNQGQPLNVLSPPQVSRALFPNASQTQSTRKEILQKALHGNGLSRSRKELALLILECRERLYQNKRAVNHNNGEETSEKGSLSSIQQASTEIYNEEDGKVEVEQSSPGQEDKDKEDSVEDNNTPALKQPRPQFVRHDDLVESLFHGKSSISSYWKEHLKHVTRPTAKSLLAQLDASGHCPMGYDPSATPYNALRGDAATTTTTQQGKKGSFLAFCREAKQTHGDCLIVTRCGDFYETFGVDAVMLVEHCGLNPMSGKAKAGFPFRSIQPMLDCLTSAGFRMAVYEEALDTDASSGLAPKGGAKSRLKTRHLAQIVSPASPTYLYNRVLGSEDGSSSVTARPYVGVLSTAAGYTLVEISIEERVAQVSERLTAEAVACRLAAYPPSPPLFWVPRPGEDGHPPFLPSRSNTAVHVIPPELVPVPQAGVSDTERAKNTILAELCKRTEFELHMAEDEGSSIGRTTMDDFVLLAKSSEPTTSNATTTHTYPLHVETASQLGLLKDPSIPSLLSSALPDTAPAATKRFLKRYLLTPPPAPVCDAMGTLVEFLKDDPHAALPPLVVPSLGKTLSLMRAGQASAHVYGELLHAMEATVALLEMAEHDDNLQQSLVGPLLTLLEHESGMGADAASLKSRCLAAIDMIEGVVSPLHHAATSRPQRGSRSDTITNCGDWIPFAFWERNEATWRGRIQPVQAEEAYMAVEVAAEKLKVAIAKDFFGLSVDNEEEARLQKSPIVQDIFNNLLAIKQIPAFVAANDKEKYIHPRDRNGKILKNRYTTEKVKLALTDYVAACEEACSAVAVVLTRLSQDLYSLGHVPSLVQASHANLILSTAFYHSQKANSMGWNRAQVVEDGDRAGFIDGVWPYWMQQSEAVPNSFELKDLFLLTAPNMAGKSTLMRAVASAALLSVCGFCAPLTQEAQVRRFDHLFVRGASADVPAEHKSAFGAEMGDIAALLRCCGANSLAFVDELGRGTSPKDGTRLAGAVLEAMAKAGISGVFATHLHDILDLPLECSERINNKQMAIHDDMVDKLSGYQWTYQLVDGVCTDSMALVTAAQFGLPEEVLARAEELSQYVEQDDKSHIEIDPPLVGVKESRDRTSRDHSQELEESGLLNDGSDMSGVVDILVDASGQTPLSIPPSWNPPASLEGQSCVYLLRLADGSYYVGETDSFQQRLRQHRRKGESWSRADAVVVPIAGGKSDARALESLLIQRLAKAGYYLRSTYDGRSIRTVRSKLHNGKSQ